MQHEIIFDQSDMCFGGHPTLTMAELIQLINEKFIDISQNTEYQKFIK